MSGMVALYLHELVRLGANQFGARTSPRASRKINFAVARLTCLRPFADSYLGVHRKTSCIAHQSHHALSRLRGAHFGQT